MTAYPITTPEDLIAALAIREIVFIQGQGVPAEEERDEHDRTDATHYLARATDGTACGTARWRPTEKGVKLERFAVLANHRNQAAGAALLGAVLHDVAAAYPTATVYLHAQLPAVRFYERHGFARIGDRFSECDIEHYRMVWQRPAEAA